MKYLIYYIEDTEEKTRADVEHMISDVTEEATQRYLVARWSAFIPMLPTDGEGATREEARANAIHNAYGAIASYLDCGQFKVEDFNTLTFEDAPDTLSLEELSRMGPQFHGVSDAAAAE